jgi:hypothetical protein
VNSASSIGSSITAGLAAAASCPLCLVPAVPSLSTIARTEGLTEQTVFRIEADPQAAEAALAASIAGDSLDYER